MTTSAADQVGVGIHPHVERAVVAVAEAALGRVELGRADAEVEERPAESGDAEVGHDGDEGVEPCPAQRDPVAESFESRSCGSERIRVLIEANHGNHRVGLRGAAGRALHLRPWHPPPRRGARPEEPGNAFGHDGVVMKAVAHGASLLGDRTSWSLACSPPVSSCRRDFSPTGETEAGGVGAVHLRFPGDCRRATGRCALRGANSILCRSLRQSQVGSESRRVSGTVDRFPAGGVPELDAGEGSDDDDVVLQAGEGPEVGGDGDAALAVGLDGGGTGRKGRGGRCDRLRLAWPSRPSPPPLARSPRVSTLRGSHRGPWRRSPRWPTALGTPRAGRPCPLGRASARTSPRTSALLRCAVCRGHFAVATCCCLLRSCDLRPAGLPLCHAAPPGAPLRPTLSPFAPTRQHPIPLRFQPMAAFRTPAVPQRGLPGVASAEWGLRCQRVVDGGEERPPPARREGGTPTARRASTVRHFAATRPGAKMRASSAGSQSRRTTHWKRAPARVRRCEMPTTLRPSISTSPGPSPAKQICDDHGGAHRARLGVHGSPCTQRVTPHVSPSQCAARPTSSSHSASVRGHEDVDPQHLAGTSSTAPPPLWRRRAHLEPRRTVDLRSGVLAEHERRLGRVEDQTARSAGSGIGTACSSAAEPRALDRPAAGHVMRRASAGLEVGLPVRRAPVPRPRRPTRAPAARRAGGRGASRLLGQPVALADVARPAGGDDVLPHVLPASAARQSRGRSSRRGRRSTGSGDRRGRTPRGGSTARVAGGTAPSRSSAAGSPSGTRALSRSECISSPSAWRTRPSRSSTRHTARRAERRRAARTSR